MKQMDFEIKATEYFEIILESERHVIGSSELITILENYRQLLKGVNVTLNKQYAVGYDIVDFDVIALEKGSFRIPISIKKFCTGVAIGVLGNVIADLFKQEVLSTTVNTDTEAIVISKQDLMENHSTKEAVVNIAKVTVESDSISSLSLNYTKPDGTIENVRIEKTQLEPIASMNTDIEPDVQTNVCVIPLTVVAPVLDGKKVHWKFRTQTGQNISAKMDDEQFLDKMEKEHVAFGKHDVLKVELETTLTGGESDDPKYSYRVRKVIEYPKYKKNNAPCQTELDL